MPVILAPGDYGTAGGSNTDPFEASALPVMIIDGEAVVCGDNGIASFDRKQSNPPGVPCETSRRSEANTNAHKY